MRKYDIFQVLKEAKYFVAEEKDTRTKGGEGQKSVDFCTLS